MKNFLPQDISDYCERFTQPEPALLQELARFTRETMPHPEMLSGLLPGRMLSFWARALQAQRILEIGTYTGYSALCMAEGLTPKGTLVTCELDPKAAAVAQRFIDKSTYASQIKILQGKASDLLATLEGPFDLVFIDADKESYPHYYEAALRKTRQGGMIILDNCLRSGEVLAPLTESAQAIHFVNELISRDERVRNVVLPLRDGHHVVQVR